MWLLIHAGIEVSMTMCIWLHGKDTWVLECRKLLCTWQMRYPCRLSPWVKKIVHTKHCGIAHAPWKPASISRVLGNVFTEIPSGWSTFQPISVEASSPSAHLCSRTTALIIDNDSCDRFATGVCCPNEQLPYTHGNTLTVALHVHERHGVWNLKQHDCMLNSFAQHTNTQNSAPVGPL